MTALDTKVQKETLISMLRPDEWEDIGRVSVTKKGIRPNSRGKYLLAKKNRDYSEPHFPDKILIAIYNARKGSVPMLLEAEKAAIHEKTLLANILVRDSMYKRYYDSHPGKKINFKEMFNKQALSFIPALARNKIRHFPKLEHLLADRNDNRLFYLHDKGGRPAVRAIRPMPVLGDYRVVGGAPENTIIHLKSAFLPHSLGDYSKLSFAAVPGQAIYAEPIPTEEIRTITPEQKKAVHRFERLIQNLRYNRKHALLQRYQQRLKSSIKDKDSDIYKAVESLNPDDHRVPRSYIFTPPSSVNDYGRIPRQDRNGNPFFTYYDPTTYGLVFFFGSETADREYKVGIRLDRSGKVRNIFHQPGCRGYDSKNVCWHIQEAKKLVETAHSREP